MPHPSDRHPHRVMLLTTARSYRDNAFLQAAGHLGIDVIQVVNMAQDLARNWHYAFGVDFDHPEAAAIIAKLAAQRPVQAILAVDDSGGLVAAQASARLGLAHNSPQAAEAARDKYRMRTLLAQAGVPCPRFHRFTTADPLDDLAAADIFPCVVKPLSLSGSRGVIRANNPAELGAAVQRLSRLLQEQQPGCDAHPYLVEEFIPGMEVALEGILQQGKLTVLALFDKPDPLDGPFFEETLYITPSRLPQAEQAAIADCTAQAAAALGLQTGPIHAELRVNPRGPWIVEVAGRSIGGLCSHTLRFGPGVSLEEIILRQACGMEFETLHREDRARGVMMIPIPEGGMLKQVNGVAAAKAVPGIGEIQITAKLNYPIVPLPEGESYLGFIFAQDETPAQVEAALRKAHSRLHFHIVPDIPLLAG